MPTIGIKGIRLNGVSLKLQGEDEAERITADYSLISTADKVLANQSIGGFNGMKVAVSAETKKALDEFVRLYRNDIHSLLGLDPT